jgi:small acid-soluble spore protein H (minor)
LRRDLICGRFEIAGGLLGLLRGIRLLSLRLALGPTNTKKIMESKGVIEVLYEGSPVWIENVLDNNTVQVSNIQTNDKQDVSANMLVEKGFTK